MPLTLTLIAYGATTFASDESKTASRVSPVQFLVEAAASDFHANRPPFPVGFRDVRFGHILSSDGEKQYMLCGQFGPEGSEGEWTDFATIKTDNYEQWLGAQASGLCQRTSVKWDDEDDLSVSLKNQLDSLH